VFKILLIRNGVMIGSRDFVLKNTGDETEAYLFRNFIEQFYAREIFAAPAIYCSSLPEDAAVLSEWLTGKRGAKVRISRPSRGIKKKLVSMAEENAEEVLKSRSAAAVQNVAEEIADLLNLDRVPESIGAFDISNIGGTSAVGAFVCWEHGSFNKSQYRHVRIDAVKGPDDYAMMKEMVRRTMQSIGRRERGAKEGMHAGKGGLPDLVIIDGGREHLQAAQEVLREQHISNIMAVSLAKDPDRVFLEGRDEPVRLDNARASSLLLRKIRDEVHRFAIRYHRKLRARKAFDSALDSIYGLGRKRRFALLERFGSIEAIKGASVDELSAVKGLTKRLAQEVLAALNKEKDRRERMA
jgi:excinuclease ABC subunit C